MNEPILQDKGIYVSFNDAGSQVENAEEIRQIAIKLSKITRQSILSIEHEINRLISTTWEAPNANSMMHSIVNALEWEDKKIKHKPTKNYRDLEYKHKRG